MAHPEQRDFFSKMRSRFPEAFNCSSVLEIGSLNINGTVRDFFKAENYLGVDVAEGAGVDLVIQGQDIDAADDWFDCVVSAECFEHNPYWVETFANMVRMSNRFVFFTCATEGRAEHGTTRTTPQDSPLTLDWDYYRNLTEDDFRAHFNFDDLFEDYGFEVNAVSHDLYFYGIKRVQ